MRKFKGFLINGVKAYIFPDGVKNIGELIDYLNRNYNSFVELESVNDDKCAAPYYIEETFSTEKVYWNVSLIHHIEETDITVLPRIEYEQRLRKVIQDRCVNCVNYVEGDDLESHIEKINLDGECFMYEPKK